MTARVIVTSKADVACFVCERRLLPGEHPEIFLVDGAARTVCELCAPRAAYQGWPRGDEDHVVSEPELISRRRGGLLARLRRPIVPASRRQPRAAGAAAEGADASALASGEALADGDGDAPGTPGQPAGSSAPLGGPLEHALEAFNRGPFPRRIASLSRSLGTPEVSVVLDNDLGLVTIVVAWELCWYRYRVDLDEQPPEATMVAEGRTLEELGREERLGNAFADELGSLLLVPATV
jgi:hypothetical protein